MLSVDLPRDSVEREARYQELPAAEREASARRAAMSLDGEFGVGINIMIVGPEGRKPFFRDL